MKNSIARLSEMRETLDAFMRLDPPPLVVSMRDIPGEIPYKSLHLTTECGSNSAHVGQLKLLLAEIQFLTIYAKQPALLIYVGSGPGHSRRLLADMFPQIRFVLVDPQEHIIRGNNPEQDQIYFRTSSLTSIPRQRIRAMVRNSAGAIETTTILKGQAIPQAQQLSPAEIVAAIAANPAIRFFIIEDLFTDEFAREFATLVLPILFISDIRTTLFGTIYSEVDQDDHPSDADVILNSIQQHNWVRTINPLACMLKFRAPYINEQDIELFHQCLRNSDALARTIEAYDRAYGISVVGLYERHQFHYMSNDQIYVQAYPGPMSSETRLVATREHYGYLIPYSPHAYENRMFYYNLMRECCFVSGNPRDAPRGYDGCLDCRLARVILEQYAIHVQGCPTEMATARALKYLENALCVMERSLVSGRHGGRMRAFTGFDEFIIRITMDQRSGGAARWKRGKK